MSNIINLKPKKRILIEANEVQNKSLETRKTPKETTLKGREMKKEPVQQSEIRTPEIIEWQTQEFTKHQKDILWFLIGGIIAIIIFAFALFTKNFIFALIIALSLFLIYIWSQKEPRQIKFSITAKGIKIADEVYNFENLKSFWIFYDPPDIRTSSLRSPNLDSSSNSETKYLSVISKKLFMPKIIIPLGETNPNRIRDSLLKYLPEEEQEESMIDVIGRYLRY